MPFIRPVSGPVFRPVFRSASSIRSESSDVDVLAGVELAKLQRQVRILENNRRSYIVESREIMRRQMDQVKRLRKENEDLVRRLAVARNRINQKGDKSKFNTLRSLLRQRDEVVQQITEEKKHIALLDKEIQVWNKRLDDQKQSVGRARQLRQQKIQLQKRTRIVNNQLYKVSTDFSSRMALNSQLRDDITTLQIEHKRFEQLYKQLETEMLEARKAVATIVSTSAAANEARDEAQARLTQLKEKAERDRRQYEIEMKELLRLQENDRRMSEFIAIKLQERAMTEEALLAKKKNEEKRKHENPEEEQLKSYNDVVNKILELTGTSDLKAALDRYTQVEERNFAQFNYVNEQNNQKELLQEQIKQLRHKIEEVKKREQEKEAERCLQLKQIEARQEKAAKKANYLESKLKSASKIWEQLKNGIESLFGKLQCDQAALEHILGGTATVRSENVPLYLCSIEKKTSELLAMYSLKRSEEQDKPFDTVETVQLFLGQKFQKLPQAINLRPPTTGHKHDPIAEEDRKPLTHKELKEKVMKDILSKPPALTLKKSSQSDIGNVRHGSSATKKRGPVILSI
ncbi:outer dynein arm-docking complex subunit 1 [Anolis carolinensis]|uniref:ODAD1 central coiled coil region domain-containing protein n=1 Tax=Anolis carolinensis TaxID=28377 RepID=H9GN50_ANOCA|nr:PREDICTED: coiled-coil domain-containing protein 114 [Anolis carolinensis]XP_008116649.1 PREDICTED: coiled-coil domain-containing protein 114 [Anolis carolinensis]|eukprot:XP_008116648.1 PREDICTED: coiled-coil domain-containing protein 114 [Anolis carolinensis]